MPETITKDAAAEAAETLVSYLSNTHDWEDDVRESLSKAIAPAMEAMIAEAVRRAHEAAMRDVEAMMRDSDYQAMSLDERLKKVETTLSSHFYNP